MDAKKIEKANHKIAIKERISTQLVNLLSTPKGEEITRNIGFMTLPELIHKYGIHCLKRAGGPKRQMNMLMHAVAKAGQGLNIRHTKLNIVDYTKLAEKEAEYDKQRARFVANYQKNKPAVRLTKYEQKLLNKRDQWKIKLDDKGKPITKTEKFIREGELAPRMLYDSETGIPIFQYSFIKNHHMGRAYLCNKLEERKVKKWDKRHPAPTEVELAQDLFPEMLIKAHYSARVKRIEQIRKILADTYFKTGVTAILKDSNDNITKIFSPSIVALKNIGPDRLSCATPLKPALIKKLQTIANNIQSSHPMSELTCIHLHSHEPGFGKVITMDMLKKAA